MAGSDSSPMEMSKAGVASVFSGVPSDARGVGVDELAPVRRRVGALNLGSAEGGRRLPGEHMLGQAHGELDALQQRRERRHLAGAMPLGLRGGDDSRQVSQRVEAVGEEVAAPPVEEPTGDEGADVGDLTPDAPLAPHPTVRLPVELRVAEAGDLRGDHAGDGGEAGEEVCARRIVRERLLGHGPPPSLRNDAIRRLSPSSVWMFVL